MVPQIVSDAVSAALHPDHFFVAPPAQWRLEVRDSETIPWEVFRGHLLDASRTRRRQTFAAWHVFLDDVPDDAHRDNSKSDAGPSRSAAAPPPAPRVSIRWEPAGKILYVSRNILTQGWEAYESQPGVISSRPIRRWTPELIATITTSDVVNGSVDGAYGDEQQSPQTRLTGQLEAALVLAWTGVSRLPITSVEAPLPDFALGRMAYFPVERVGPSPHCSAHSLFADALANPTAKGAARRLEVSLRAAEPAEVRGWLSERLGRVITDFAPGTTWLVPLIQSVFHHVSLTPYTHFAENLLLTVERLAQVDGLGPAAALDVIGHMLRHLVRHLTAYDLVRFHSFGANYPDALWLDALLKHWLTIARSAPDSILGTPADDERTRAAKRLRRRALRQAWLVRATYEGHRVPDHPTSRGENVRVIPGRECSVPDEQIAQPGTRRKALYDGDPTDRLFADAVATRMLVESLNDLRHPFELRELGAATFLDRPFGVFKAPGEVDRTPLLAYEAFSGEVAGRRFEQIRSWTRSTGLDFVRANAGPIFEQLGVLVADFDRCVASGYPASDLPGESRSGIIMLEDARVAAGDFVFLRTVRSSYELLATTPLGLTTDQATMIREWSKCPVPSLLIRTASPETARAGQAWITRFELHEDRLRSVTRIALAPSTRPEYTESFGVEFLRGGLELRPVG